MHYQYELKAYSAYSARLDWISEGTGSRMKINDNPRVPYQMNRGRGINSTPQSRMAYQDPYQSIDLIEYYKIYNRHKELRRGKLALEGAKVNFFRFFTIFKGIFLTFSDLPK